QIPNLVGVSFRHSLGGRFSVNLGLGIGGVVSLLNSGEAPLLFLGQSVQSSPKAFASFGYQGAFGFNYALAPRWSVGIGCKILGTTGLSGKEPFGATWNANSTLSESGLATLTWLF